MPAAWWRPATLCSKACSLDCKVFFINGHYILHYLVRSLRARGNVNGHRAGQGPSLPVGTLLWVVSKVEAIKRDYGRLGLVASPFWDMRGSLKLSGHPRTFDMVPFPPYPVDAVKA